tara:strand:- start:2058 stop:2201 length:144 start_codon:yes stop_codon:yes gene_type:complete
MERSVPHLQSAPSVLHLQSVPSALHLQSVPHLQSVLRAGKRSKNQDS